jgi:hypothetical protein
MNLLVRVGIDGQLFHTRDNVVARSPFHLCCTMLSSSSLVSSGWVATHGVREVPVAELALRPGSLATQHHAGESQ